MSASSAAASSSATGTDTWTPNRYLFRQLSNRTALENKRVLVTGGAGFIGSNIANHLADKNTIIAVDDCYLGTPENLDDNFDQ